MNFEDHTGNNPLQSNGSAGSSRTVSSSTPEIPENGQSSRPENSFEGKKFYERIPDHGGRCTARGVAGIMGQKTWKSTQRKKIAGRACRTNRTAG